MARLRTTARSSVRIKRRQDAAPPVPVSFADTVFANFESIRANHFALGSVFQTLQNKLTALGA